MKIDSHIRPLNARDLRIVDEHADSEWLNDVKPTTHVLCPLADLLLSLSKGRRTVTPKVGGLIWIPCEVKPGPFSDERLVRIQSDSSEWLGFVPVESLHDAIAQGKTFVRGTIVDVTNDRFEVFLAGHAVTPNLFAGLTARVTSLGSVEAGHSPVYQ